MGFISWVYEGILDFFVMISYNFNIDVRNLYVLGWVEGWLLDFTEAGFFIEGSWWLLFILLALVIYEWIACIRFILLLIPWIMTLMGFSLLDCEDVVSLENVKWCFFLVLLWLMLFYLSNKFSTLFCFFVYCVSLVKDNIVEEDDNLI